jgi:hypothetical protein
VDDVAASGSRGRAACTRVAASLLVAPAVSPIADAAPVAAAPATRWSDVAGTTVVLAEGTGVGWGEDFGARTIAPSASVRVVPGSVATAAVGPAVSPSFTIVSALCVTGCTVDSTEAIAGAGFATVVGTVGAAGSVGAVTVGVVTDGSVGGVTGGFGAVTVGVVTDGSVGAATFGVATGGGVGAVTGGFGAATGGGGTGGGVGVVTGGGGTVTGGFGAATGGGGTGGGVGVVTGGGGGAVTGGAGTGGDGTAASTGAANTALVAASVSRTSVIRRVVAAAATLVEYPPARGLLQGTPPAAHRKRPHFAGE